MTVEAVPARRGRPAGRRFGTLVHAVLAAVPLDATADEIRGLADVQARLLSAPALEAEAAAGLAEDVLRPSRSWPPRTARRAPAAPCLREVPVSLVRDGVLIDGQADLAFEDGRWVGGRGLQDRRRAGRARGVYRRQVALYAEAITHATGRPARGVLLRV